jgi:lysophospholipase L1-like esterase
MSSVAAPHCYLALGDSMTIDLYPNFDAHSRWQLSERALGAASLLYRNDPWWSEFVGQDLHARYPAIVFANLASDGATIDDVRRRQLPEAEGRAARIITLTAGGNDLLWAWRLSPGGVAAQLPFIMRNYQQLVAEIRRAFPEALLLLTTIYDPTDGTGRLDPNQVAPAPIALLAQLNEVIRQAAATTDGSVLADAHHHFLGHGITASTSECWYWPSSIIEPAASGANELRRLWWQALMEAGGE